MVALFPPTCTSYSVGAQNPRALVVGCSACTYPAGRQYIAVAPHYTSQNCSSCGAKVKKSLSTRTHKCSCGCELQRDHNAAINILEKALKPLHRVGNTGRKQATGGHPESNAWGVATSTLLGANLVEQVATANRESHARLFG